MVSCGEDFCLACGDCLACYPDDPCYENMGGDGNGRHVWPEGVGDEEKASDSDS